MSKGTFFVRYRNNPAFAELLDIQEDKFHHLHLPVSAAAELRRLRPTKETHGNWGRVPQRDCPSCGHFAHTRHKTCGSCGYQLRAPEKR
jgi:hypothetical protein